MFYTKTTKTTFVNGIAILTASAVIVKLIGVCYKIPLVNLLGTQGMGYFNAAYDVYALLCIISTTGLPVAISVVMNKYGGQHKQIFMLSLGLFLTIGFIGSASVFLFADWIATVIGAPPAAQSLRFIAPAVLFICITGACRGYFQANRNMVPTAISQIIEAAGKLLFGLLFAFIALQYHSGPAITAAFSVLGISIGTFICLIYLLFCIKTGHTQKSNERISNIIIVKELIKVAVPVTLGAILSGLSKMIDLGLIMRRLQDIGFSQEESASMYGCYSSMVMPLFNAVPALFGSLAMPLIPHLTRAIHHRDVSKQTELLRTTFKLTALICIPSALGMGMMSDEILMILYPNSHGELSYAVRLLILVSMAIPASCMITTTNAVLQAYDRAWISMLSTGLGCAIKAISLYILAGIPSIGILAAPISTILSCALIVSINLFCMIRIVPIFDFSKNWMKILLVSIVSVGAACLLKRVLINTIRAIWPIMILSVAAAVIIYVCMIAALKLVRLEDLHR